MSRTGIVEALEGASGMVQIHTVLSVASMLAMEINNGGRYTRKVSPMLQAKELCGTSKRTKRGVLVDYVAWLTKVMPEGWEPNPRVKLAMQKPAK